MTIQTQNSFMPWQVMFFIIYLVASVQLPVGLMFIFIFLLFNFFFLSSMIGPHLDIKKLIKYIRKFVGYFSITGSNISRYNYFTKINQ